MTNFLSKPIIEAMKQFGRVVVLAIIPVSISGLSNNTFDWRVIAVTGVVAGLMFVDKLLHENNKELPARQQNSGVLGEKGITGF